MPAPVKWTMPLWGGSPIQGFGRVLKDGAWLPFYFRARDGVDVSIAASPGGDPVGAGYGTGTSSAPGWKIDLLRWATLHDHEVHDSFPGGWGLEECRVLAEAALTWWSKEGAAEVQPVPKTMEDESLWFTGGRWGPKGLGSDLDGEREVREMERRLLAAWRKQAGEE